MIRTCKILSILLSYPDKEIQAFLAEVTNNLRTENILGEDEIQGMNQFTGYFSNWDITDWQELYVQQFDNSKALSLNLFEHVYGDSKDRGQAMVDLMNFYNENNMEINRTELPDYLPAFLEFASLQKPDKAAELLSEPVEILKSILNRLKEKNNPYKYIFEAILSLPARLNVKQQYKD